MHLVLFSCIGFWKVGPGGCFAPFLSTKCMNNWIVECHRKNIAMFFRWTKIALMDQHECIVISDATSVQPLCRSRVDLSIIGPSEVRRKIWGIRRWCPGHCSVVMDSSVVGAAPVSRKTSRLKQHKTDIANLKWDSNSISNRWCKMDVKLTSPKTTWLQQMR